MSEARLADSGVRGLGRWIGAVAAVAVLGCGPEIEAAGDGAMAEGPSAEAARATEPDTRTPAAGTATRAVAVMRPADGGDPIGQVLFTRRGAGEIRVETRVGGLGPGRHAHHVHEFGDCRAEDDRAAGPHYPFVELPASAEPDFITGNLGDVVVPMSGEQVDVGTAVTTIDLSQKGGLEAIVGRAVLIHARPNDTSQPPDGGAGERVACGVIGIVQAD